MGQQREGLEGALWVEAGGRGSGALGLCSFNCFALLSQRRKEREKKKERKRKREGETKKRENHLQKNTYQKKKIKPKPNQTTNSNIPNTLSQKVANMDILFISLVTWSYKQTWQKPLRTQKNRTLMDQCEERSHDILGGQKHNGNLAQCC